VAGDFRYLLPWLPLIEGFVGQAVQLPIRDMTVTSFWRNPTHNRNVGGAAESQHIFALAFDVTGTRFQRDQVLKAARARGLVAVENPRKQIVHVQQFQAGALGRAGVTFPT